MFSDNVIVDSLIKLIIFSVFYLIGFQAFFDWKHHGPLRVPLCGHRKPGAALRSGLPGAPVS